VKIIAVANQKGGVGKTTVDVNLPVFLANHYKKKCLVVDVDPQANATTCLLGSTQDTTTFDRLLLDDNAQIPKYIVPTKWGVDLIPSNISAANVELELLAKYNRDRRLETRLSDLGDAYDFVFIDTPPAVVGLVTLNALVAAHEIYIVCNTEKFAVDGLVNLMRTIAQIRNDYRKDTLYFRCVLNQFDRRRVIDREIKATVEDLLGALLFETLVNENTDISKATAGSQPLYFYNQSCSGFFDFLKLAQEVLELYGQKTKNYATHQRPGGRNT
jgi:chromosome partitioning protein